MEPVPGCGNSSVCPPSLPTSLQHGFACVETLCKLLLLCGSRGEHTQLLCTLGKSLSPVPGGGKPAASGGGRKKIIFHQKLCLQVLCLSSWWAVLSQQPFNSERAENT